MSTAVQELVIGGPVKAAATVQHGMMSLNALPHGARARVVSVGGADAVARRLMEMGVVPGAPVCVVKVAPLGDPIQVRVRGYHLALRRTEAQTISVVTT
ncbi:MAG TPA: ferrous iron transport protein A [Pyrinomonadaceae bacterium]|nr:ferrous iron transport protein A [Pyrinomonadaceae bacterium]